LANLPRDPIERITASQLVYHYWARQPLGVVQHATSNWATRGLDYRLHWILARTRGSHDGGLWDGRL